MTWTARDGWFVAPSRAPRDGAFRRQRLLGIAAVRPHFWLFAAGGDIVAHHCTVALQALGDTPRQAIEALRAGVRHHVRLHGSAGHQARLHAVPVTPEPVRPIRSSRGWMRHCRAQDGAGPAHPTDLPGMHRVCTAAQLSRYAQVCRHDGSSMPQWPSPPQQRLGSPQCYCVTALKPGGAAVTTAHRSSPSRQEVLRDGLQVTADLLKRRLACHIPSDHIDDYVALDWLEWKGGTLRLTTTGENIRRHVASQQPR
jgi:hypothetical protein